MAAVVDDLWEQPQCGGYWYWRRGVANDNEDDDFDNDGRPNNDLNSIDIEEAVAVVVVVANTAKEEDAEWTILDDVSESTSRIIIVIITT